MNYDTELHDTTFLQAYLLVLHPDLQIHLI